MLVSDIEIFQFRQFHNLLGCEKHDEHVGRKRKPSAHFFVGAEPEEGARSVHDYGGVQKFGSEVSAIGKLPRVT